MEKLRNLKEFRTAIKMNLILNEKLKYNIKNSLLILLLFIVSINIYACKKSNTLQDNFKKSPISENYREIDLKKISIKENTNTAVYELRAAELKNIFLHLNLEKENAILEIEGQKILTDFNFTYDISVNDAINRIKLLTNKEGNLIFLFPVASEEYLTFQILKYDKLKKSFSDSNFYFETHDDIHNLYLNSKATLSAPNNTYLLKIGSYEFKGNFQKKDIIKNNFSKKNTDIFNGIYNICINHKREDSIKSEICYEIKIKSYTALIDANTSVCKGNYIITDFDENEIHLVHENDKDCFFKIKKEDGNYFFGIKNSKAWHSIQRK